MSSFDPAILDPRYAGLTPSPRRVECIAEDHSVLSASGAERWLHCTLSARLESTQPDKGSFYSNEGRLAHKIGELRLRKQFFPMGPEEYRKKMAVLKKDPLYQPEMDGYVEVYFDLANSIYFSFKNKPYVFLEKRLDYSEYVPEGFGTGDCGFIGGNKLVLIDFKYGKGVPVAADKNHQMMCYALGAYTAFRTWFDIQEIEMHICQPRIDYHTKYVITIGELLAWGESIRPIAIQAWQGAGEHKPGDWCRFCRVAVTCQARINHYLALEDWNLQKPPVLSNADIGAILTRAQGLAAWVKQLEAYALAECLAGREVPGWKAVEGRASRVITDYDAAIGELVKAGYDKVLFYETLPIAMTKMEKIVGKKKFGELVGHLITIPPGKPALAPEDDKRHPITRTDAVEDFAAYIEREE